MSKTRRNAYDVASKLIALDMAADKGSSAAAWELGIIDNP